MRKLLLKNIFNNKRNILCLWIVSISLLLFQLINGLMTKSPMESIRVILYILQLYCISLSFIAYDYLSEIKHYSIQEMLSAINSSILKISAGEILILSGFAFIFSCLSGWITFFLCVKYKMISIPVFIYIIKNTIINLFFPCVISILIGASLSRMPLRLLSYFIIIMINTFSGIVGLQILENLPTTVGEKFFKIYDIISFTPLNITWAPNYSFGFTIQDYHVEHLISFIFFLLCVVTLTIAAYNKKKRGFIHIGFMVLSIILFCISIAPASKLCMTDSYTSSDDALFSDSRYYSLADTKEKQPNFNIVKYELSFSIHRQLSCTATLELSEHNLNEYYFTLYHGYEVCAVYDDDHNALSFSQDGDYIIVHNNLSGTITNLIIEYEGYAPRYYSNEQGMCLPGFFPYYPHAGFYSVFDDGSSSFAVDPMTNESEFDVIVKNYSNTVFSNLSEIDHCHFYGKTNALTLVSGFYSSYLCKGIEIIVPSLDPMDGNTDIIDSNINQLLSENDIKSIKKIIVVPPLNQLSEDEQYCIFSDHMIARQIFMISDAYERISIPKGKRNLLYLVKIYESSPANLNEYIELIKNMPNEYNEAILFQIIIDQFNEETFFESCNMYLHDSDDDRTITTFLNNYMEVQGNA